MVIDFALARYDGKRFVPLPVKGELVEIPECADVATFAVLREPPPDSGRLWAVYMFEVLLAAVYQQPDG